MSRAFVALGGNLGPVADRLLTAMAELDELPRTRLLRASSLYRSAPVGYADQPDFVNAVAMLETSLTPTALMASLLALEAAHGRVRSIPNGPRTLDLDLLLYDGLRQGDGFLVLPHPRMHVRAFVLAPLLEIAPDCVLPGLGPARGLLAACADREDLLRLDGVGFDSGFQTLCRLGRGSVPRPGAGEGTALQSGSRERM
ncbi:MAG: 2-amino-4-hydroxy-6-hydroxymethyldihydropteridine diphosphokinase [Pseudomonadota bacterium]